MYQLKLKLFYRVGPAGCDGVRNVELGQNGKVDHVRLAESLGLWPRHCSLCMLIGRISAHGLILGKATCGSENRGNRAYWSKVAQWDGEQ